MAASFVEPSKDEDVDQQARAATKDRTNVAKLKPKAKDVQRLSMEHPSGTILDSAPGTYGIAPTIL